MSLSRRHLLAALAAAPLTLRAQGFDRPPPPGPELPWPRPVLGEARLDNGLRLLVAERRGLPLHSLRLLLPELGSLGDPAGKAGLARLHLLVLSRGALREGEPATAGQIAAAAEGLGASLELATEARAGSLGLTVGGPALLPALELLADLLLHPTLEAAELERCREELLDGREQQLADPVQLAALLAGRLFWGEGARGQLLSPASLARVQRRDLLALQARLRPERCILVMTGDLDLDEARALAQRHFGAWRSRGGAEAAADAQRQPGGAAMPVRSLLVDQPGAAQASIALASGHAGAGQDWAEAQLALAVLGQGFSSRLNQALRIQRGLAYGVDCEAERLPGAGLLLASAQTRPEQAAEAVGLLSAELLRLGREPVPAAELNARRAALLGEQARALETTAGLAGLLSELALDGRPLQDLAALPQALAGLTPEDLQAFAARHWQPASLRRVIVADLARAGAALRQLDPAAWVIPRARLDLASPTLRSR